MRDLQAIQRVETAPVIGADRPVGLNPRIVLFGALGLVALCGIGTWLVWYGVQLDHSLSMQEIQTACGRTMPEAMERCVDTVVIQRGGARR